MYTVTFLSYPMHPRNEQQSSSGALAHPATPEPAGSVSPAQANTLAGVSGRNPCSEPGAGQVTLSACLAALQPENQARFWGWKQRRPRPVRDSPGLGQRRVPIATARPRCALRAGTPPARNATRGTPTSQRVRRNHFHCLRVRGNSTALSQSQPSAGLLKQT